jgi:putative DNA primase/helicase
VSSTERATEALNSDHQETLNAYEVAGLRLVPLRPEDKTPKGEQWQSRTITRDEIESNLARRGGVGIQVGECSGWLCAVDLDHPAARKLAPHFLPTTLTSGKASELPSHYVYISEGLGFRAIRNTDLKHIIDIVASNDGAGHQFVVEPSVHETKGPYKWTGGFNPSKIHRISSEDLARRVGLLAACALLAIHYPKQGEGRHDFGLCVAGYLLRNGQSQDDVHKLMTRARALQPEPPTSKTREGIYYAVKSSAEGLDKDKKITGGRTLEKMVPRLPERLAQALGWEQPNMREQRRHYMRTDLGNAERFVDAHCDRVLWCPARKAYLCWDGKRYAWDERGEAVKLAHLTARSIFHEAADAESEEVQKAITKWALASQNESRINAMLSQAKPYLAVGMEELDRDPWLINCQNGTLDLRTGRLKDHDPDDRITKIVPVDYDLDASAPRFKQFLKEALVDDALIKFVKRYSGYTLTGITRERLLAILYGFGKNGKTTLVELLHEVLGDYARNTDVETLLIKKYQGVGNDVAALKGARFVSAAEVEKGRRLAESKVKQLTGRDTVTARFLFGENFDFKPEFKLWLSTNNKPVIQGTDDAIWDRIRLIPFTQRFEGSKADAKLPDKLRGELAGVFAWMVEGCLEWQEHGLEEPKTVADATKQYREEMDTLAAFFEDRCIIREGVLTPASRLYKQYQMWCDDAGENAETQKMFGMRLSERGFVSEKIKRGQHKDRKGWRGIGLRADDPEPEDPDDSANIPPDDAPDAGDGPPGGPSAKDRPRGQDAGFAGNSTSASGRADHSGPKNQNFPYAPPRVEKDSEKRSASSASSAVSEEQEQRIRKLVDQGMSEKLAREDVLGKGWVAP